MNNIRIIPRLDIKGPNLVKGIQLEGLRLIGDPSFFANHYYKSGADELIYVDVVASLYGRNSLTEVVKRTSNNIFIPLTVGGGIRSLKDINELLLAGADRVLINTQGIKTPNFINEAAKEFGSSTLVVGVETYKFSDNNYYCLIDNGRQTTDVNVEDWVNETYNLGAGEISITSISNEGVGDGYDLELLNRVNKSLPIPIIFHGGGGNKSHIEEVLKNSQAPNAVAISSIFHYDVIKNHFNSENMKSYSPNKIQPIGINELKKFLDSKGLKVRI